MTTFSQCRVVCLANVYESSPGALVWAGELICLEEQGHSGDHRFALGDEDS